MNAQYGPLTHNYFITAGVQIDACQEDGRWYARCPACAGWSAVADSWSDLFRLTSEFHNSPEAKHRAWFMWHVDPPDITWTGATS